MSVTRSLWSKGYIFTQTFEKKFQSSLFNIAFSANRKQLHFCENLTAVFTDLGVKS